MRGSRRCRAALVEAAQTAANTHPHWKAELARLEPRLGRNRAIVAIARKLLVAVWHVLTQKRADRFAEPERVARKRLDYTYKVGQDSPQAGQSTIAFVREQLDRLHLGADLKHLANGNRTIPLPSSTQPSAAPAAEPKGQVSRLNARAAQEKRSADATAKHDALAAKREATEAKSKKPRKPRSDKGVKRGPHAKKT